MSSDVALRIEGLGKKYTIRHKDHDHVTLAQAALHRIRHPRGAVGKEEFWALRGVSLEVPRGQVLGVIGHNGAGKSTLLKILSRITPPTTGKVEVFGRIGSLLEVGTGFHPELTGRENIYLNGSILGMRTKEIDRQFDAIVDFSGVEKFLDTPVKRYSSGMYVRLAFAVAAHLDTEILLMDEVLAVGDAEFQKKCLGKMGEVAKSGRTVVFVSHNLEAIRSICDTACTFRRGALEAVGSASQVIQRYSETSSAPSAYAAEDGTLAAASASFDDSGFRFSARVRPPHDGPLSLSLHLAHPTRGVIVHLDSRDYVDGERFERGRTYEFTLRMTEPILPPDVYGLDVFIFEPGAMLQEARNLLTLEVGDDALPAGRRPLWYREGCVIPEAEWAVARVC